MPLQSYRTKRNSEVFLSIARGVRHSHGCWVGPTPGYGRTGRFDRQHRQGPSKVMTLARVVWDYGSGPSGRGYSAFGRSRAGRVGACKFFRIARWCIAASCILSGTGPLGRCEPVSGCEPEGHSRIIPDSGGPRCTLGVLFGWRNARLPGPFSEANMAPGRVP